MKSTRALKEPSEAITGGPAPKIGIKVGLQARTKADFEIRAGRTANASRRRERTPFWGRRFLRRAVFFKRLCLLRFAAENLGVVYIGWVPMGFDIP